MSQYIDFGNLATEILSLCRSRGFLIATAESCTGGLIAAALTDVAGSSDVFDRGFVSYFNQAKTKMLDIPEDLIEDNGAVSEIVARHMAQGALKNSKADISIAVTGIAGPGGGSTEKPVGLVHIAVARSDGSVLHERCLFGSLTRGEIRENTVLRSFELVAQLVSESSIA